MKITFSTPPVVVMFVVVITAALSAQVLKMADLQKLYGSRWVVLPFPDSRMTPGSVISVKKNQVAWESDLRSCGAPESVMKTNVSDSGKLEMKGEAEYGANAAISIKGIEAGPDFKKVKKTQLRQDSHGPEGLDRIALGEWFNNPATKLSKTCTDFLNEKDVFIVQESYKVSKGAYTLFDEGNKKLELKGLNLGILKISGGASAKTTADGSLEFDMPVYTAIRRVKRFSDGSLKTLGTPAGERDEVGTVQRIVYGAK